MPRSANSTERTKEDKTPLKTRGRNGIGENGTEQIKTRSSRFDFYDGNVERILQSTSNQTDILAI